MTEPGTIEPLPAPPPAAGPVLRIPADAQGGDPTVAAFAARDRSACALIPLVWSWVVVGAVAAAAGGVAGSLLAGPVSDAPLGGGPVVATLHRILGNPLGCLAGMLGATLVASLLGARLRPRGVPAGQEPWMGGVVMAVAYLLVYDWLACLGVVTGLLSLASFAAIGFRLLALARGGDHGLRHPAPAEPEGCWPVYTVLVPMYRETAVAQGILASLARLDYPRERLDVKFLLEADDPETLAALEKAGIPAWSEVVVVPPGQPKTKPRACNHGLARARGEFLVIFDAEDRPDPDQLKQAVMAFRASPPSVACLQAHLAYHNHGQNLLTRWFAIEYNIWFRRYLAGLVRMGVPIPLGGTSNHFRTDAIRDLGWDPFNVTEDCDLGVRLYMADRQTRILDSVTWEEANSRVGNWIRQRSRWLKGYLITHLVWARRPWDLVRHLGAWGAVGFLLSVLAVPTLAAINLLMWAVGTVYAACLMIDLWHGYALWELLSARHPLPGDPTAAVERLSWQMLFLGRHEDAFLGSLSLVFFCAAVALLVGNLAFIAIAIWAGRRPGQHGLWWAAVLSPLYWILIGVGAWKGIWQLLFKPHYWEKTVHGLDQPTGT